jgi:hypothetical protein
MFVNISNIYLHVIPYVINQIKYRLTKIMPDHRFLPYALYR